MKALSEAGHDVHLIARYTDDYVGERLYSLKSATTVGTGIGPSPLEELRSFKPDIVHVHNLFPNWGEKWLTKVDTPIVATAHNFRPVCSAATLLRDGSFCDLCPTKGSHHAVMNACYRSSKLATIPLALASRKSKPAALLDRADAVVFLSSRAQKLYEGYLPGIRGKGYLIPNFIDLPTGSRKTAQSRNSDAWVYTGRLAKEKGILDLIKAWPKEQKLIVIGDGPLARECRQAAEGKPISFHGLQDRDQLFGILSTAKGLVFPSLWPEMSSLVYIEALALGIPVVALVGNSVADDVSEAGSGVVLSAFEDLSEGLRSIEAGFEAYSAAAKRRFERRFSRKIWTVEHEDMYKQLSP